MAHLSRITVADILELSLDQRAGLDGFVNRSPNGRPLDAADFIAMVETKLSRKVRPGKRGRKPLARRMDLYGKFVSCPRNAQCPVMPRNA